MTDPDVWQLGQLRRTELVIEYLNRCVLPGDTGSPMTAQETVPGMSNDDMIGAILDARDAAGTARVKAAGHRAWDIHHAVKRRTAV